MITVHVELFAMARELAGRSELAVSIPSGGTSSELLDALVRACPALGSWKDHLRVAVNFLYVDDRYTLRDGDRVAVIPPVSGG